MYGRVAKAVWQQRVWAFATAVLHLRMACMSHILIPQFIVSSSWSIRVLHVLGSFSSITSPLPWPPSFAWIWDFPFLSPRRESYGGLVELCFAFNAKLDALRGLEFGLNGADACDPTYSLFYYDPDDKASIFNFIFELFDNLLWIYIITEIKNIKVNLN